MVRKISRILIPEPVIEGAGVKLKRSIATRKLDYHDPFLLLDHFASGNPDDYIAGFPMHPHRGIETVTYMLSGTVKHRDSLGNSGTIGPGDVQWMTAGRGILHEEMPQPSQQLAGFQLWVNLPAKLKMTAPRYQDIPSARIAEIEQKNGVRIRIIAGTVDGVSGPVTGIAADPLYLDVSIPPQTEFTQTLETGHNAFSYVFDGKGNFGEERVPVSAPALVVWGDGDSISVATDSDPARFLLVAGKPLHEPVARYGPFVMNTREEIEQTLQELRMGTFVGA